MLGLIPRAVGHRDDPHFLGILQNKVIVPLDCVEKVGMLFIIIICLLLIHRIILQITILVLVGSQLLFFILVFHLLNGVLYLLLHSSLDADVDVLWLVRLRQLALVCLPLGF